MTEISKTSMKRSKPSYFMAILGVALVLFILGMLGWITINASKLENYFKGSVQVHALLGKAVRKKRSIPFSTSSPTRPYARKVEYITKEMAKAKFIGDGNEDWNKVLGLSIHCRPVLIFTWIQHYVNKDSLNTIVAEVQKNFIVSEVKYPDAVVSNLNNVVRKIEISLLVLSAVLSLIAIILIDNTIKLAMFSNRFLIKTMQMVGATRWFISKPFDKKAILNGLISAVLAILAIGLIIYAVEKWWLPEIKVLRDNTFAGSAVPFADYHWNRDHFYQHPPECDQIPENETG